MLIAAAVCPQTPLLVPQIAAGAADELAEVRKAAIAAVGQLCAALPDRVITVAPGGLPGAREVRFGGSFRGFGVDLAVGDGPHAQDGRGDARCTGLLVGSWLLNGHVTRADVPFEGWEIGEDTDPEHCARIGHQLAARAERVGLLVMGDGSACRTLKAPGYLDDRAVPFDDEVSRALADADTAALAAIDPTVASELMAAGRAPWQVLAGAVDGSGAPWRGELLSYHAPYGVGYFTASWAPRN
ncbi:MAG: class III extradiol dioxygenase subunit B-like domain-containing protein [Actinocrinis sp.]